MPSLSFAAIRTAPPIGQTLPTYRAIGFCLFGTPQKLMYLFASMRFFIFFVQPFTTYTHRYKPNRP